MTVIDHPLADERRIIDQIDLDEADAEIDKAAWLDLPVRTWRPIDHPESQIRLRAAAAKAEQWDRENPHWIRPEAYLKRLNSAGVVVATPKKVCHKKESSPAVHKGRPAIPVCSLDAAGNVIQTYRSATEAAEAVGGSQGTISAVLRRGKSGYAYGFRWGYAPKKQRAA